MKMRNRSARQREVRFDPGQKLEQLLGLLGVVALVVLPEDLVGARVDDDGLDGGRADVEARRRAGSESLMAACRLAAVQATACGTPRDLQRATPILQSATCSRSAPPHRTMPALGARDGPCTSPTPGAGARRRTRGLLRSCRTWRSTSSASWPASRASTSAIWTRLWAFTSPSADVSIGQEDHVLVLIDDGRLDAVGLRGGHAAEGLERQDHVAPVLVGVVDVLGDLEVAFAAAREGVVVRVPEPLQLVLVGQAVRDVVERAPQSAPTRA